MAAHSVRLPREFKSLATMKPWNLGHRHLSEAAHRSLDLRFVDAVALVAKNLTCHPEPVIEVST